MSTQGTLLERIKTYARTKIGLAVRLRYMRPDRKLTIIGVTGTKGKTITTSLIAHILNFNGLKAGSISTVSANIGGREVDTGLHVTSPEPWEMPKYLRDMVRDGAKFAVLESTSMGLQQGRFAGINFDVAVITNISSDHLDYHGTWENYAEAKFMLINRLKPGGLAVVNADHDSADWIGKRAEDLPNEVYASWYTKKELQNVRIDFGKMEFDYKNQHFVVKGFGEFFLENVLAAIKACSKFLSEEQIAAALQEFSLPSGRMEIMQHDPYKVIVDFAHTPDSLERALHALRAVQDVDDRIIVVFGCAGLRDHTRRQMGEIAAKFAKLIVLTAEDPRTESLFDINNEIVEYAERSDGVLVDRFADTAEYKRANIESLYSRINRVIGNHDVPIVAFDEMATSSRFDAIEFALNFAKRGDIVLLAGKGHERSLCFGANEVDWSDQEAVRKLLPNIGR